MLFPFFFSEFSCDLSMHVSKHSILAVTPVMLPNVRWVYLLNYSTIEKTQWGSINQTLLVFFPSKSLSTL